MCERGGGVERWSTGRCECMCTCCGGCQRTRKRWWSPADPMEMISQRQNTTKPCNLPINPMRWPTPHDQVKWTYHHVCMCAVVVVNLQERWRGHKRDGEVVHRSAHVLWLLSLLEQYLHCTGKCLYPAHLLLCSSTSSN